MQRFFFHLREGGRYVEDPEGEDFLDLPAARAEAEIAAREMLAERVIAGRVLSGMQFEICDTGGARLDVLDFRQTFRLPED